MKKLGLREIAKLANVSLGTVDRALHGRKGITEETRNRILTIAESVGYSPDLAARALSVGRAPIQIGVSIPREIHYYFDHLLNGIATEVRRYEKAGVQVLYSPTKRLGIDDVQRAAELIDRGVDVLVLAPGNPEALTPVIDDAESNGIRVICVDTDAPASKRSTLVSVDAQTCGKLAAELMSHFVSPGSDVAVFTGMFAIEDHARKVDGFRAEYTGTVQVVEAHEDEEEAFQKCFALLSRDRTVAGIYVNTVNCLPVCRAIAAAGLSGTIKLITTDLFSGMLPFFEKGTISASIHGRPFAQGENAIRLAVDHLTNGRPLPPLHHLLPHVVMRSNCSLFREARSQSSEPPVTGPSFVDISEIAVRGR
jgi:LacI family transcriptional regulator